jgi:hypothetical protein
MSLVRLLEIGRSLNAIRNTQSRYRMQRENLLPKFGMAGSATNLNPVAANVPLSSNELRHRMGSSKPPAFESGSTTEFRLKYLQWVFVKSSNQLAGTAARAVTFLHGLGAKLMAPLGLKPIDQPNSVNRNARSAVAESQAELSLDNVTVIRNDLSDADFHVIQVREAGDAAEVSQAPEATGAKGQAGSVLGKVATRFFKVPVGYQDELGFHRGVIPAKKGIGWPPFW